MTIVLPIESPFAVALREVAAELGLPELKEPHGIRMAIVQRDYDRESRVRQLESAAHIRKLRVAELEGQVRSLRMDRDEWSGRAQRAERHVYVAIVLLVMLGAAFVVAAGWQVGWGVT